MEDESTIVLLMTMVKELGKSMGKSYTSNNKNNKQTPLILYKDKGWATLSPHQTVF
jgi:hypothetical protein